MINNQQSQMRRFAPPDSSFERRFQKKHWIKRNKQFFDIQQINSEELSEQIQHRKPLFTPPFKNRMSKSFRSSRTQFNQKIKAGIKKFKNRCCNSARVSRPKTVPKKGDKGTQFSNSEGQNLGVFSERGKGITMETNPSRQYFSKLKQRVTMDQRQFNNFTQIRSNNSKALRFEHQGPKLGSIPHSFNSELKYDSTQLYQQYYFRKSTMNCRVNYEAEKNRNSQRIYFRKRREQDISKSDLNPEGVLQGQRAVMMKNALAIETFYTSPGRELPSQMDQRKNTPLTDYWRNLDGSIQRPSLGFNLRSFKDQMTERKLNSINKKKARVIRRQDTCDLKYFRLHNK